MRRPVLLAFAVAIVTAGCQNLGTDGQGADGQERLPGPAYYLLTIEPDAAIDTRDIVLTSDGDYRVRPRDLLDATGSAANGPATIHVVDGRRLVNKVGLPGALEATVDGRRCDGIVELLEDTESDATLAIDGDRCELRLDQRHRMDVVDHGLDDATTH